jgi:4-hydroxybenzoate polyprenyltransferase
MKQETWIQIITLIILVITSLFYNPLSADIDGKFIFVGIIVVALLFFVFIDLYKSIEDNKIRIKLFDEKWGLSERIKSLENLNKR